MTAEGDKSNAVQFAFKGKLSSSPLAQSPAGSGRLRITMQMVNRTLNGGDVFNC